MNKKYDEKQFKKDVSWIGEMPRGYVVREFIEKWSPRVRFVKDDLTTSETNISSK